MDDRISNPAPTLVPQPPLPQKPTALPVRVENIPVLLKQADHWLVWKFVEDVDAATGEVDWDKPPLKWDLTPGSSTNVRTWTTFAWAMESYRSNGLDGIGFALCPHSTGKSLIGVDLDHCRNATTGHIESWAREIVAELDSYTEVSPSGKGLRIFVFGELPPNRCRKGPFGVYNSNRCIAVTGHHVEGTPGTIEHRPEQLLAVHARFQPPTAKPASATVDVADLAPAPPPGTNGKQDTPPPRRPTPPASVPPSSVPPSSTNGRHESVNVVTPRLTVPQFDFDRYYSKDAEGNYPPASDAATAWLGDLPQGIIQDQAADIYEQLWALEKRTNKGYEVQRKFLEWLVGQSWLCAASTREHVMATGRDQAQQRICDAQNTRQLLNEFGALNVENASAPLPGQTGDPMVGTVIRRGMPTILGGPYKALKTNLALAMAIHAVNGLPFLGLPVPRPLRIGCLFGELDRGNLQSTAHRITARLGVSLNGLDLIPNIPNLCQRDNRERLAELAEVRKWDLAILDPVYRALGGKVDVSNIYSTAARLRSVVEVLIKVGCTTFFVHHATRALEIGRPMVLGDLYGAGMAEYFRGWFLVNRMVAYDPNQRGHHDLILDHGDCAGGAGRLRIHVDEGFGQTAWGIQTISPDDRPLPARGGVRKGPKATKEELEKKVINTLHALAAKFGGRVPRTELGEAAKVKGGRLTAVLKRLAERGEVTLDKEEFQYRGKSRERHFVVLSGYEGPPGDDRERPR